MPQVPDGSDVLVFLLRVTRNTSNTRGTEPARTAVVREYEPNYADKEPRGAAAGGARRGARDREHAESDRPT